MAATRRLTRAIRPLAQKVERTVLHGCDGTGDIRRRRHEDQRQRNLPLVETTLQGQSAHARQMQFQEQAPGLNAIVVFEEGFGTFEGADRQAIRLKLAGQGTTAIGVTIHHVDCALTAREAHAESFHYWTNDRPRAQDTGQRASRRLV